MNHLYGIVCVVSAAAAFAALDTATKYVSVAVPFAIVMWFRFGFQVLVTAGWLFRTRGVWLIRSVHVRLQLYRGVLLTSSSILAFFSLKLIPVADFTALMMLTPLLVMVMAALTLRERISSQRWLLLLLGFVGAMVIIRPTSGEASWAFVLPLLLVLTSAGFQLLTYRLAKIDDAVATHLYTGWMGLGVATALLPWVVQHPSALWLSIPAELGVGVGATAGLLFLIAVCATLGHGLLILGYARAPVATLTPYLYAQIPFSVLAGWLIFRHQPDSWTLCGIVIVAISGVFGTWLTARERQLDVRLAV